MPFSLNGAAASFQRVMDKALRGVQDCAVTYINDILIYSPSWEVHMTHIRWILDALRQTGLTVNLKKSKLGQRAIQYLGFHIRHGKIWAGPDKVATLWDVPLPLPPTKDDLQRFLGLANYYWGFVPWFSTQASPLTDLLKGKGQGTQPVRWTLEAGLPSMISEMPCARMLSYMHPCRTSSFAYTWTPQIES